MRMVAARSCCSRRLPCVLRVRICSVCGCFEGVELGPDGVDGGGVVSDIGPDAVDGGVDGSELCVNAVNLGGEIVVNSIDFPIQLLELLEDLI